MNIEVTQDATTGRYLLSFDASMYKQTNCKRKVLLTMLRGLRVSGESGRTCKMEYGTGIHKGLALHYSGSHLDQCVATAMQHLSQPEIVIPDNEWRNPTHCGCCMMQYIQHWQRAGDLLVPSRFPDGTFVLEQRFSIPFYQTKRTEVSVCGTIDFKGAFAQQEAIVDHKVTALWDKAEFFNSFALSPQLMLYKHMYDTLFHTDVGYMVNGIFIKKTNKNEFERSQLYNPSKRQMESFIKHFHNTVADLVWRFEYLLDHPNESVDAVFEPNYICCDEKYGMCPMAAYCLAPTIEEAEMLAKDIFVVQRYDPMTHQA